MVGVTKVLPSAEAVLRRALVPTDPIAFQIEVVVQLVEEDLVVVEEVMEISMEV